MWRSYLQSIGETPESTDRAYQWWHFCDNQADADALVELVLQGKKRATAPSLWFFEESQEPVPKAGDLDVVTDWSATARCVTRSTRVDIVPYLEVGAEFAAVEGEGDGSLEYWRRVHWPYYRRELEPFGRRPEPDMPIICQRFEVVFPPSS
ncbi:MAG: ASCH domain-containing protein [Thermoanaerobaculia bacterium]|nr:ASCH domain-containing protein [Thermoanaerobaculia bacterium]